jgi:hypothetical protein
MTPPETEHGFGTGLRSKLERQQNGDVPAVEVVAEEDSSPVSASVDVIVQATVPELDNVRGELQAALEREHILRDGRVARARDGSRAQG